MPKLFEFSSSPHRQRNAFSLVEVVIAVGVFAISIAAIIGILAAVGKGVSDVQDSEKAARLVTVVQARLQTVAFADIAAALKTEANLQADDSNANYNPSNDARIFFASEDGSIVAPYTHPSGEADIANPWTLGRSGTNAQERDALKFFELALVRNGTLSPNNDGGFLAFTIRVRWPAYLGDGTRVSDNAQKNVLLVPAAVTR